MRWLKPLAELRLSDGQSAQSSIAVVGNRRGDRGTTANQQLAREARTEALPRQSSHFGNLATTSPEYLGYKSFILFITSETSAILAAMLFMVIEHFKDVAAIGERFRAALLHTGVHRIYRPEQ